MAVKTEREFYTRGGKVSNTSVNDTVLCYKLVNNEQHCVQTHSEKLVGMYCLFLATTWQMQHQIVKEV